MIEISQANDEKQMVDIAAATKQLQDMEIQLQDRNKFARHARDEVDYFFEFRNGVEANNQLQTHYLLKHNGKTVQKLQEKSRVISTELEVFLFFFCLN